MAIPTLAEVIGALDHRNSGDVSAGEARLFASASLSELMPLFIAASPCIRNSMGRNAILFRLVPYARTEQPVIELAIASLNDSAYLVRMQALSILAYSQRKELIPEIQPLLHHRDAKTRADATAAIDALEQQNHHYWVDRGHSERMFWVVNPTDDPEERIRQLSRRDA